MNISVKDLEEAIRDWEAGDKNQRLGQYLINTLIPEKTDPVVFYEESHPLASVLFYNFYVDFQ